MTAPTEDLIARLEANEPADICTEAAQALRALHQEVALFKAADARLHAITREKKCPRCELTKAQCADTIAEFEVERLSGGLDVERYNRVTGFGFEDELYALTSEYADEIEAAVRGKESTRKARKHYAKGVFKNGVKALLDRQLGDIRELIRSMPALSRSALTGSAQG